MKVALSASHSTCQEAIDLLKTCDLIYTTQIKNYKLICEDFPDAIVKIIPDCCPDMMEFLKNRHIDDEVVGFGDLMELRMKEQRIKENQ